MGEIAEMMLDGTLCEGCGVYLGGERWEVPLLCNDCAADRRRDGRDVRRVGKFWQDCGATVAERPVTQKVTCPTCGKRVKSTGLADHVRVVHGARP
jgi:Zn finger protein HypA/HybF involved in hydrogenase expression